MFEITLEASAKQLLDEHFTEHSKSDCLRLFVRPRQSSKGRTLALKPDTSTDRDIEQEIAGYKFVISRHLADQIGNWVKVDTNGEGGFFITAERCFNSYCEVSCTLSDACAS
ncbi:adhesin [Desulfovibrio sp. OttesenSCG-928-F07]|nr:adhesin [Desulfovibrio sp. OttesenSCG-928-F07]